MPRTQVQTACQRCRKKRTKCDGRSPCQRCEEAGKTCEYEQGTRQSKNDLRAEIGRFKKNNDDRNKLLSALASGQDLGACQTLLQGLMDGPGSQVKDVKPIDDFTVRNSGSSQTANPLQPPHAHSSTRNETPVGLPCFDQLLSWKTCRPRFSDTNLSAATLEQSTILSLPPLLVDAYTSHSRTDTWTRTGWTRAHIRHLFDALLTWDYLPFSLLCHDLFLRDFDSGSTRFCSSTLVHAILALATRLVNGNDDDSGVLPSGWYGSKSFFDDAVARLHDGEPYTNLPDIQALGMLSLYQLRCGRETEAHQLAEAFATHITKLCQREPLGGKEEEQYAKSRATTYCAAVSLTRILLLATGRLFNTTDHTLQVDIPILDATRDSMEARHGRCTGRPNLAAGAHSASYNYTAISAKVFQLTEWVYKLVSSARSGTHRASGTLSMFYAKCLEWYDNYFALLDTGGTRTPFVLFVHMYYHFCLLCAFRPFISHDLDDTNMQPHKICTQAAQNILALAQSYDDLFTLRRVSGLTPYLVCASGLFSLAMQDSSSRMDAAHLRLGDHPSVAKYELDEDEPVVNYTGAPGTPSYFKISATGHARLLLAKMASTHPAAMVAKRKL